MSEPIPQPSLDEQPPIGTPAAGTEPPTPRPRWRLLLVVAAVAMLVGALAATTVVLVIGRGDQHQYAVNVFLNKDVTAEQKAAIESALDALEPVESIRFESREQAWQHFKEMFKDSPDMIAQASADAMPESFRLTTKGREFDCARLVPIRRLPGVDEIQVIQRPTKGKPGAAVGCGAETGVRASASAATPSPTATLAREELAEALQRSQRVAHRYTVRGDLPEGQRVKGSGAFDPKARRFQATIAVTGGKYPSAGSRIVIGADSYVRPADEKDWVHVDLKRVKRDDPFLRFDWVDPTGLKKFTSSIASVQRTGPHSYTGRFDPDGKDIKSFLPVGAPSVVSIGMPLSPFTITTDDQGWVTSIRVELTPSTGPKLTMTTTMSDHGKPLKIKAPAGAGEAADFYYD
ncbi:permease-like cell division protein FtsX [Micromonospora coerulea]|uniref:permease-like cell division protein FtsX n=1 Tax=Micromonospora coerulea TaxID=47856 RepID=UPI001905287A|nr:permease-like cell division protein FtsX [Micromonospora veneta]